MMVPNCQVMLLTRQFGPQIVFDGAVSSTHALSVDETWGQNQSRLTVVRIGGEYCTYCARPLPSPATLHISRSQRSRPKLFNVQCLTQSLSHEHRSKVSTLYFLTAYIPLTTLPNYASIPLSRRSVVRLYQLLTTADIAGLLQRGSLSPSERCCIGQRFLPEE